MRLTSIEVEVAGWVEAVEACFERGWSDGLPVVPATEDAVRRFVEAAGREPDEVVVREPTRRRTITVEKVAINAVLAGCRPEYMPVVLAALEAMGDPAYNLHGAITSTGGSAPFLVVNGPVRRALGINGGVNCFGPGWRANATIGRALRLVILNCLGAQPGVLDRSTQGHPGQVHLLHRRAGGREPLGAAPRRARPAPGDERGDRVRRRGAAQRADALRPRRGVDRGDAGRRHGRARQLQPGPVVPRPGPRARPDPRPRRVDEAAAPGGALRARPSGRWRTSSARARRPVRSSRATTRASSTGARGRRTSSSSSAGAGRAATRPSSRPGAGTGTASSSPAPIR